MSRLLAFTLVTLCLLGTVATSAVAQSAADLFKEAEKKFDDADWEGSIAGFKKFQTEVRFSTLIPQAMYYEGWALFNLKKYKEAADKFKELAARTDPQAVALAPESKLKEAESYRELKDYDKAIEIYKEFQKKFPEHALLSQAFLGEAWVLYKKKEYDNATRLTQNIRTKFAQNMTARLDSLFLLAQIYTEQEKFDEARKVYDEIKGMRYNPRATEALFLAGESMYERGEALMNEDKRDLALKSFSEAIDYYQRVQSKDSLLAAIEAQIKDLENRRLKDRAQRSFIQSSIDSLKQVRTSVRSQSDLRPAALFRVANCYQSLEKPEEASMVFEHFRRLYPDHELAPQAQFGLIQAYNASNRPKKSEAEVELLKKKYPDIKNLTEYAMFLGAKAKFDTGQHASAIEEFKKFIAGNKDEKLGETAEFYIATAHFAMEDYAKAMEQLQEFIKKHPKSGLAVDAKFRLGRANFELYQKAGANEQELKQKLVQTADPAKQKEIQGQLKELAASRKGHLAEAIKYFEEVKASDNAALKPDVTFQLGYLNSFMSEFDPSHFVKSADMFEEFIKQWPENNLVPEAFYQLAKSRDGAKDEEKAIAAYRQLIERFPETDLAPFAAWEIAVVHTRAKRSPETLEALRAYIQKYPTHEKVGPAFFAIGMEFETNKKFDQAVTEYQNLVKFASEAKDPNPELIKAAIGAQLQTAKILEGRKKIDEALATSESFLAKFGNDPAAAQAMISQIAAIYARAKQYDKAYETLDKIALDNIGNANARIPAYQNLIEMALAQGNQQKAYEAALKLRADPARDNLPAGGLMAIVNAMLAGGHYAEANEAAKKLVTNHPNDLRYTPLGYVGLGNSELNLNNVAAAEEAFKKVLQPPYDKTPAALEATLGIAKVYESKGMLAEALAEYEKVLRRTRGESAVEAAFRMGGISYQRKEYKPALAFYARLLLERGPRAEEAAYRTAECHKLLGGIELARNSFSSYIARFCKDPNKPGRFCTEAQQQLTALPQPTPP